jgi:hypothetical protein
MPTTVAHLRDDITQNPNTLPDAVTKEIEIASSTADASEDSNIKRKFSPEALVTTIGHD